MPKNNRPLAVALAFAFGITACGGDETATTTATTTAPDDAAASSGNDLSADCPKTLVLQIDWFPGAEYGMYFSLIGDKGKLDKDKGAYKGPLLDTGVDFEIRAGGPFIGQQTVQSLMFQDDSINLGLVHTDDAVRFSSQLPVVAVVAPLEHSPLALVWDPSKHDFKSFEDVGASKANILVFTKEVNYVPFLVKKGLVPLESFDDSFDGSYTRFVADNSLVQQAFVTETPFRLKNEIKEFGKDVDSLLVSDAGYDPYLSSLSVKKDSLDSLAPCLEKLVPIMQQAQVDYLTEPEPTNQVMVDVVSELASFFTLSMDLLAFGNEKMAEFDIVSNGDDDTLGNFDPERVETVINDFQDVFGTDVDTANPDVKASDIFSNDFIDPAIKL